MRHRSLIKIILFFFCLFSHQAIAHQKMMEKVAVLLPLSGENAKMGHAVLNGIKLSYFKFKPSTVLKIYDTGSDLEKLDQCLKAIRLDMIQIVIGPIFKEDIEAIREFSFFIQPYFFTLSNQEELSSSHIFNFGLTPRQQINSFATSGYLSDDHISSINLLAPKSEFGYACAQAATKQDLFSFQVHNLENAQEAQRIKFNEHSNQYPLVIVMGWDLESVPVAAYLKMANPNVKLTFLGDYDFQNLQIKDDPVLKRAPHISFDNRLVQQFTKNYQKNYNEPPHLLSFYGFDVASVVFLTLKKSNDEGKEFSDVLSQTRYQATSGTLEVNTENGKIDRVLQIVV
jgi:ABC-type branched-subunit amino acid transport system substrate-binding protein